MIVYVLEVEAKFEMIEDSIRVPDRGSMGLSFE